MNMLTLEHNRPVRIAGSVRIECVSGTIWLTNMEIAGDVFLHTGDHYELAWPESVLVEALGQARIMLHAEPATGRRLIALVAGVLSSLHERMRTLRLMRRRTPLAG
jgi:hypothetical protein